MTAGENLYQAICKECGVGRLTDDDIARLGLLLKERLGELGDLSNLTLGESVNVDTDLI